MSPHNLIIALHNIANKIDRSSHPSIDLVKQDLHRVIASLRVSNESAEEILKMYELALKQEGDSRGKALVHIALNPNTPAEICEALAKDAYDLDMSAALFENILRCVAGHDNTP